jgi:hypothetical protein
VPDWADSNIGEGASTTTVLVAGANTGVVLPAERGCVTELAERFEDQPPAIVYGEFSRCGCTTGPLSAGSRRFLPKCRSLSLLQLGTVKTDRRVAAEMDGGCCNEPIGKPVHQLFGGITGADDTYGSRKWENGPDAGRH